MSSRGEGCQYNLLLIRILCWKRIFGITWDVKLSFVHKNTKRIVLWQHTENNFPSQFYDWLKMLCISSVESKERNKEFLYNKIIYPAYITVLHFPFHVCLFCAKLRAREKMMDLSLIKDLDIFAGFITCCF